MQRSGRSSVSIEDPERPIRDIHGAPDGAPVHYERHRPEQTTLYRLVQQHAATFFAQAEAGADLPQFVKDGFDAFLECGRRKRPLGLLHRGLHATLPKW